MPYQILLVDDDRYFRAEFKELMSEFNILEAETAESAQSLLKKPNNIDMVILDEQLPDQRGTKFLDKLHYVAPEKKIVILTGHSSKQAAIDALRGHADDYIEKPLNEEKIKKIRDFILSVKKGEKDSSLSGVEGKIKQIKYFIERNYNKNFSLSDISEAVFLSPKYISRIFKKETKKTVSDYKLEVRVEKAKQLLKDTGNTVENISFDVGYQNPESFGKMFHKLVGCSPREFRENDRREKVNRFLSIGEKEKRKRSVGEKILKLSKDAVIEYDNKCKITLWPKSAENMYGWSENEVLGKRFCDLTSGIGDKDKCPVNNLNKKQSDNSFEVERVTKTGEIIYVWIKVIPTYHKNKKLNSFITVERNITGRKKDQDKLINEKTESEQEKAKADKIIQEKTVQLEKTIKQLEKEKHFSDLGRMSSIIAHELRGSLNVIQTALWNIRRKNRNHNLNNNLLNIEKMIVQQEELIDNLLNYSHIKYPVYRKVLILNLIDEVISITKKRFDKYDVSLLKRLKGVKSKYIETDPAQFNQIISNIIMNAYEALSDRKKPKIIITAFTAQGFLDFKISDNGPGIDDKTLKNIYEPFFSLKPKGTGLGLSVCKEIAELHKAEITVNSQVGKGTTVILKFPLKKP